jgi:hypothetical protein
MAKPCTRTAADDVTDALRELQDAQAALAIWRTHLLGLQAHPSEHKARGLQRAKNIAVGLVLDAAGHTQQACAPLESAVTLKCATATHQVKGSPHKDSVKERK